ncbi:hypothetical protein PR048_003702 [Dryococelus australis]|uniref:Maturase n=1 Tax=Dryococelus australis TaxID=614101 RepID=A0ABQ9IPD4_9NEOP|nr:hypothetical protein PR048_003702 [Dryococelus australis]
MPLVLKIPLDEHGPKLALVEVTDESLKQNVFKLAYLHYQLYERGYHQAHSPGKVILTDSYCRLEIMTLHWEVIISRRRQLTLAVPNSSLLERQPMEKFATSSQDNIDFKRVYTEVTFAIVSEFIRHALDDCAPIADLQGNKKRIPYCQMWGNTGATANKQTSEVRLYKRLWSLAYRNRDVVMSGSREYLGRSGIVVRLLASHLSESGSLPGRGGFRMPLAAGVFSGISRFPRPFIPELLHAHLASPSSILKTSISRRDLSFGTKISALAQSSREICRLEMFPPDLNRHQSPRAPTPRPGACASPSQGHARIAVEHQIERGHVYINPNPARQAERDKYYGWNRGDRGLCHRDTAPARRPEMEASRLSTCAYSSAYGIMDKTDRLPPRRTEFNPRPGHSRFSHVRILHDDATGRRVFSGISRFPLPFIPILLHTHLNHQLRLSRPRC